MSRKFNLPVFVPHVGCPHDCAFCNQKRITGQSKEPTREELENRFQDYFRTIEPDARGEIAFFGGSFTGIPLERQKMYLECAEPYRKSGVVYGIRLSTRPDYISREKLDFLMDYGVTSIELGVQSMNGEVLRKNNRGHTPEATLRAVELIRDYPVELGLQMMTGLFGSDPQKDWDSAKKIADLKPDTARIYPTIVLQDTKLMHYYQEGCYQPQKLEEAVELCGRIFRLFTENQIQILRIGLQSTELIQENNGEIIGPYHSSFGELVRSWVIREEIEEIFAKNTVDSIEVFANKRWISQIIGNKKANLLYFKRKGLSLTVNEDASVETYRIVPKILHKNS